MQNNQVRIGLVSTTNITHRTCLSIKSSDNCIIQAITCDNFEEAEQWANTHNIGTFYESYDELLEDENVDAVYFPYPVKLRSDQLIKAANKKKHILVDSSYPETQCFKYLEDVLSACYKNNVQILDGAMWFHTLRTKEFMRKKKEIGTFKIVNTSFSLRQPKNQIELGNEQISTLNGGLPLYPITAILHAYDYDIPHTVRTINCIRNEMGTITQLHCFLEFSKNRLAYFDVGVSCSRKCQIEIVGEKGVMRINNLASGSNRINNHNQQQDNTVVSDRIYVDDIHGKEAVIQTQPSDPTKIMVEQFGNLIQGGVVDQLWADRILSANKVLTAVLESAKLNGEPISCDSI